MLTSYFSVVKGLQRKLLRDIKFFLHILLSKQLVQLMLKGQIRGPELIGLDTPETLNKLQFSCFDSWQ